MVVLLRARRRMTKDGIILFVMLKSGGCFALDTVARRHDKPVTLVLVLVIVLRMVRACIEVVVSQAS